MAVSGVLGFVRFPKMGMLGFARDQDTPHQPQTGQWDACALFAEDSAYMND
jgi:hypothetical protein